MSIKNSNDTIGNRTYDLPNYEHLAVTKLQSSFNRGQECEISAHEVLYVWWFRNVLYVRV